MTTTDVDGRVDLTPHGIRATGHVIRNPTTSLLYEHAVARGEARIGEGGPLVVDTGLHTGRSPKDKFVVREPGSEDRIWWDGNQEFSEDGFERLREKVAEFLGREATLYVVDAFAGADPAHRIAVRVVTDPPVSRALREDDVHRPDRRRAAPGSSRRRSCSTRRRSRRARRRTARAPARSSCSTRRGRRC